MENLKISNFVKSPKYSNITPQKLNEFFSAGYQAMIKERCAKNYTMFDYKQGILEANYYVQTDINRHTVDLMLFALAKIEELETSENSLKETVIQLEKLLNQETNEDNKDNKEEN